MKKDVKLGKNAPKKTQTTPEIERVETNEEYNQSLMERLSEKKDATLINYEKLSEVAPEFAAWLKNLVRYGNVDSQVLIYLDAKKAGKNRFICKLYTNDHCYSISGYKSEDNDGYLGCIASTRKSRVGEDWNRGNDLPDGKYLKETFDSIVNGIVRYELNTLQLWKS